MFVLMNDEQIGMQMLWFRMNMLNHRYTQFYQDRCSSGNRSCGLVWRSSAAPEGFFRGGRRPPQPPLANVPLNSYLHRWFVLIIVL